MLLMMVATVALIWILLDLRKAILALNVRVGELTDKVNQIAANVKDVTDEVGTRTRGIVRVVDEHASTAFVLVEKLAPLLVGIGVVTKIVKLVKSARS